MKRLGFLMILLFCTLPLCFADEVAKYEVGGYAINKEAKKLGQEPTNYTFDYDGIEWQSVNQYAVKHKKKRLVDSKMYFKGDTVLLYNTTPFPTDFLLSSVEVHFGNNTKNFEALHVFVGKRFNHWGEVKHIVVAPNSTATVHFTQLYHKYILFLAEDVKNLDFSVTIKNYK